jgi:hypothetical protein
MITNPVDTRDNTKATISRTIIVGEAETASS